MVAGGGQYELNLPDSDYDVAVIHGEHGWYWSVVDPNCSDTQDYDFDGPEEAMIAVERYLAKELYIEALGLRKTLSKVGYSVNTRGRLVKLHE